MTNENPVDYLIRRCGMTRVAFTREYGFGENHLLLVAQGRKESVGPKLRAALEDACVRHGVTISLELLNNYGVRDLDLAFEEWRTRQRQAARLPQQIKPGVGSPMARIVRHFGSIAQTAKQLRVRDIVVRRYMDTEKMPTPIYEALVESPWGSNGAVALDLAQKRYFRDKGRKR
jgi:hypothetical protein